MIKILREDISKRKEMPLECIKGATLLSEGEADYLLTKEERKCTYEGKPCMWWLRSPGFQQDTAVRVYGGGGIHYSGSSVDVDIFCVRPALIISNLSSLNLQSGAIFEFGKYKFKVISDKYALCEEAIGQCAFRKDYKAENANVYEKSDVKKYVDDWFNKTMKKEKEDCENKSLGYKTDDEILNDDFDF